MPPLPQMLLHAASQTIHESEDGDWCPSCVDELHFAITSVTDKRNVSHFPTTFDRDWCGEWMPVPTSSKTCCASPVLDVHYESAIGFNSLSVRAKNIIEPIAHEMKIFTARQLLAVDRKKIRAARFCGKVVFKEIDDWLSGLELMAVTQEKKHDGEEANC